MLRVVADTNIYISALNFGGVADDVLALARTEKIRLYIARPILYELQGVLAKKFKWQPAQIRDAVRNIIGYTTLVSPMESVSIIKHDEPDNRILECAVASKADIIVSGDQDLKRLQRYRGIEIVSPREFLKIIRHGMR